MQSQNHTSMWSSGIVQSEKNDVKYLEFLACQVTSGERRQMRCFDSWYVGEWMKNAIGLERTPSL